MKLVLGLDLSCFVSAGQAAVYQVMVHYWGSKSGSGQVLGKYIRYWVGIPGVRQCSMLWLTSTRLIPRQYWANILGADQCWTSI